jgi:PAS domain S-box-containing protein
LSDVSIGTLVRPPRSVVSPGPEDSASTLLRASIDALLDPQVLLEAARDSSDEIVDFVYREVNQATCEYLGLPREELLGRGVVETMPGLKGTLLADYIRCLKTGEPLILNDFTYDNEILQDTRRYDLRVTRATATSIVLTWRDVTERFRMAQRVAKADERYRRSMENAAVGMCLLTSAGRVEDLNHALCHFFGYDANALREKTWQELTGPEYLEANWTSVKDMLKGRIDSFRMINQYVHADGHLIWGDQSVSCIRDDQGLVENFLIQVNDVTEVERALRERLKFEEFISEAITDGRLIAYAQPIVDAVTGEVVEEELLVRIVGPDGQVMVPEDFLPQARRFGTMAIIDRFMVARGIALARAGRRVAVNLSASSINDPATIAAIIEDLRRAGDAAARVSFEITETTTLAPTELAEHFSDAMRALGCRLALDDFGTGFGTFVELRGMTLHSLKIDASFVHNVLRSPQDESVVRSIVGIAREFGLRTTAEGVENADTRTKLVELGVDQLQGYLIGRPAPATLCGATKNQS